MELQELVDEVAKAETAKRDAAVIYDRLSWQLMRMMVEEGATEAVSDTHIASLSSKHRYDQNRLRGVLELVSETDLVAAGAYVPEHEETRLVESKFNATKLKPFAKRGRAIQDVIDDARVAEEPRLKIVEY
jgi:hypothetical protein